MTLPLLLAAVLASSSAPLVRAQQGTTVRVPSGSAVGLSLPFSVPGCFATGSVVGSLGETMALSRASSATYLDGSGAVQTCTNNQIRISPDGLRIDPTVTQLHPSPSTPAAGTVTFSATGAHVFWVVGSGSQALSATGTLVATGLPCTATAASPCYFNVTTTGATPTGSVAAVTGSLTRAQIEKNALPTQFVASGSRATESGSVAINARLNLANRPFWVEATVTSPVGGWKPLATDASPHQFVHLSSGAYGAANSVDLKLYNSLIYFETWSPQRVVNASLSLAASSLVGPLWTGTHRFAGYTDGAGTHSTYADGCKLPTASLSGAGTGVLTGTPPTALIGYRGDNTSYLGAAISTVRVLTRNVGMDPVADIASFGDSLTYGQAASPVTSGWVGGLAYLRGPCFKAANFGVAGYTAAQILAAWRASGKGQPYRAITLLGGINDIQYDGTAVATWATLKTIVDEALSEGKRVYMQPVWPWKGNPNYTVGREAERTALNALILAYNPGPLYTVVDTATDLDDGTGALKGAYDNDGAVHLHPNQAGHDRVATLMKAVIP